VFAALTLCALAGCGPAHVHFVLPDDFRGAFAIMPDQPDGIELRKTEGCYVIPIPETGILRIKGDGPFGSYLATASFDSGMPIWSSKRIDDKPAQGTVALWGGSTEILNEDDRQVYYWWFVGTEEEWRTTDYDSRRRPGAVAKNAALQRVRAK
jgi:hypothetical protein